MHVLPRAFIIGQRFALGLALLLAIAAPPALAQPLRLGEIEFPTSARSPEAQAHFLRGVAALHSFWYPVAREQFQRAAQVEPGFAMAHWGVAMTHNHPVWGDPQDSEAGRAALAKIDTGAGITPRERAWIDAVRMLYGKGDKPARDRAYANAMRELHERYPNDAEAALFHALALLGLGDEKSRLAAGDIASTVFEKHPNHPGAAHYTIHAWDDAEHARLALPAARRYAEIAPDSAHALHMPSHIFLQLGMWREAAESNRRAWAASEAWVREHDAPATQLDIHSLHWLLYVYLQQARYDDALRLLETMRETLAGYPKDDPQMLAFATWTAAMMAATYLVETRQWQRADALLGAPPPKDAEPQAAFAAIAGSPITFARGMAAAHTGAHQAATAAARALRALEAPPAAQKVPYIAGIVAAAEVQAGMIDATVQARRKHFERAARIMQKPLAKVAATPPPPGPPMLIEPPHELMAGMLLDAGRESEAQKHYRIALARHPGRARALLGAARAAFAGGDKEQAAELYGELVTQWRQADATLAEVSEARRRQEEPR